ncbi:replication initiation protein [Comamonas thiooxydans]|uniref:replication initiation protein n=1 Tax=Comamonas thiooxydans TaxID=363952 RepID=UPI000B422FF2|nr:replication initiation protein [Comamonas thiooxydans]
MPQDKVDLRARHTFAGPGRQLALDLFQDLASVKEATADLGFRRNNLFTKIKNLNLKAHRCVDVAYFLIADDPDIKDEYVVEIDLFCFLLHHTSRNKAHFRSMFDEAQAAKISLEDPTLPADGPIEEDSWASIPLMGAVVINNGKITFSVDKRLQKAIKNPKAAHFLSLKYVFKSIHAKIIYDKLLLFVEEGRTPWLGLEELRQSLGCTSKTYATFKYFNKYVLDVATTQINDVTDLSVSMKTRTEPGSKKVSHVQFIITQADEGDVKIDSLRGRFDIFAQLEDEFGCGAEDKQRIFRHQPQYTPEQLLRAMEYTRFSILQGKVKIRAAGFLIMALEKGLVVGSADRIIAEQKNSLTALPAPAPATGEPSYGDNLDDAPGGLLGAKQQPDSQERQARESIQAFEGLSPSFRNKYVAEYKLTHSTLIQNMGLDPADLIDKVRSGHHIRVSFGLFLHKKFEAELKSVNAKKPAAKRVAVKRTVKKPDSDATA